jgi:6-phosphogluconolactonase
MRRYASSRTLTLALAVVVVACAGIIDSIGALAQSQTLVYFGTYTGPKTKSQGIYLSRLNLATGALSAPTLAAETENPSFLAVHPTQNFLYSVGEIGNFEGTTTGSVSAFGIDRASGMLKAINRQSSGGGGPAHISADPKGRAVLVANYGGGSVAVLPIEPGGALKAATSVDQHTGSSVNPQRQKSPHAHSIKLNPPATHAYSADLGIDKVLIYAYDGDKGTIAPNEPPFASLAPGAGPRHLAFHPNGRYVYVINEILLTVTAFAVDPKNGGLTEVQTITTLPEGVAAQPTFSTAEVQVHPSGRFLYGSNRGHDSITVFAIDQASGKLTFVQNEPTQGSTPRGFGIDPGGAYLLAANQRSDSVVVLRIDPKSGRLSPAGVKIDVPSPVCVVFVRP